MVRRMSGEAHEWDWGYRWWAWVGGLWVRGRVLVSHPSLPPTAHSRWNGATGPGAALGRSSLG